MLCSWQRTVGQLIEGQRAVSRARFDKVWLQPGLVQEHRQSVCPAFWSQHWVPRNPRDSTARDDATPSEVEIFTDGSASGGIAGWGWVAVVAGNEVANGLGPVVTNAAHGNWRGAQAATNNTGEVSAIVDALEWVEQQRYLSVSVRYDSQYAACQTRGVWRAKKNKELIAAARQTLARTERTVRVRWEHVKAHSGHAWNDRADELAKAGATQCTVETPPRSEAGRHRRKPAQREAVVVPPRRVRWVDWQPTEANRIERSLTRHGVLNLLPRERRPTRELMAALQECARLLAVEQRMHVITAAEAQQAKARVRRAAEQLCDPAMQRLEVRARKAGWVSCTLSCSLNVAALRRLQRDKGDTPLAPDPSARGRSRVSTYSTAIDALIGAALEHESGETRLRVDYQFSQLGRDLITAGHISGCREQAIGVDPFKFPAEIRQAAFDGMGWEADDNAAYPRARVAMVAEGRAESAFLIVHREDIMRKFADYLFPTLDWPAQRKRMKGVINGLDMDSGLDAWRAKYDGDRGKTLVNKHVRLACGRPYSLATYQRAQRKGTAWMAAASPRMLAYVTQSMSPADRRQGKKPELRLKSYLLQEAEAVSRAAKVAWASEHGVRVTSLQHDGVMLDSLPDGLEADEVAEQLGMCASRAAGYEVVVETKRIARPPAVVD